MKWYFILLVAVLAVADLLMRVYMINNCIAWGKKLKKNGKEMDRIDFWFNTLFIIIPEVYFVWLGFDKLFSCRHKWLKFEWNTAEANSKGIWACTKKGCQHTVYTKTYDCPHGTIKRRKDLVEE